MQTWGLILLVWNLVTFAITGYDKSIAGTGKRRVPEKNLLGMAVLMGAVGVYAAMQLFHHKTKHARFKYGVPLLVVLNLVIVYLFVKP